MYKLLDILLHFSITPQYEAVRTTKGKRDELPQSFILLLQNTATALLKVHHHGLGKDYKYIRLPLIFNYK